MRKLALIALLVGLVSVIALPGVASAAPYLSTKEARSFANKVLKDGDLQREGWHKITGIYRWSDSEVRFSVVTWDYSDSWSAYRCTSQMRVWATRKFINSASVKGRTNCYPVSNGN